MRHAFGAVAPSVPRRNVREIAVHASMHGTDTCIVMSTAHSVQVAVSGAWSLSAKWAAELCRSRVVSWFLSAMWAAELCHGRGPRVTAVPNDRHQTRFQA